MEQKKIIAIIDCLTGLVIQREMTEQEIDDAVATITPSPMENAHE